MSALTVKVTTERAGLPWRRSARWARPLLLVAATPLLVFPFAWAAVVAAVLWATSRVASTGAALRWGRPGELHVRAGRVGLLDARGALLADGAVQSGWLEPYKGGLALVLDLDDGRRLVAAVPDAEQGYRALAAAAVAAEQQVLRVPLGSRAVLEGQGVVFHLLGPVLFTLMMIGPVVGLLVAIRDAWRTGHGWGVALVSGGVLTAVAALGLGLAWMLVPGEATVGRDGVSLRRLWNRRFFPHATIRGAIATEHGVQLETEQGTIQLPTATFFSNDEGVRGALARRLREALDAWAAADGAEASPPLGRRGLRVADWRASLASSVGRDDYRAAGLDPAELLRLLEAPTAPLEHRVGAALALGSAPLDHEARARVEAAIGSSAHEPTRKALRLALDGSLDDDLLDDVLAEAHTARVASRLP